ncbi:DUF4179 domain-containing protein, partial [Aneurinibacillus migulanus]|uniref:DUF4179 domain-containing protein n=2 Tax=Aneurinibacillus migulanus TaxID=47500 RepID=UPI0005BB62CB
EIESKIKARESTDLENRRKKKGLHIMKKLTIAAAGLTAAVFLGIFVSPTFASYVNSLFNDKGIKTAAENGFTQKLDMKAMDKGITIEVKEILADPLQIALIIDAKDKEGKKLTVDDLQGIECFLTDKSENKKFERTDYPATGWSFGPHDDYIIITREMNDLFNEQNPMPDDMFVHLNFHKIGNTEGKWQFKIPVDMKKASAATKLISINKEYTSLQGLSFNFKNIEFLPSATRITLETKQTKEWKEKTQKISKERGFRDDLNNFKEGDDFTPFYAAHALKSTGFAYQLLDEQGNVIVARDNVLRQIGIQKNENPISGLGAKELPDGSTKHFDLFLPIKDKKLLTLKLYAIYTNEVTDFQARLNLANLSKNPVTQKDTFGNTFTFKDFTLRERDEYRQGNRKDIIKVKDGVIKFEATLAKDIVDTDVWSAKDDTGKGYRAYPDYPGYWDDNKTVITKDENGLVHLSGEIYINKIGHQPKELTLSYHIVKKQHRDVDWKVDIPLGK